ncbi:MAG TPA: nitroreductase family protein, partial [Thermoanaerobaculia bacterium]|nr:nitroreductase family protein [Thermoanaerobaculia bacterium]
MADPNPGLFEILYSCRAMRRLKPDPVPRELLLKLIDAATQAPSGSNLQSARWIVAESPEQKARLAELNRKAVEAYVAPAAGRPEALPHQSADKRRRMLEAVLWQKDHLHEAPALIVASYEFPAKVTPGDAARAAGSVWPGVQNLLLAARALGLGAAPTTLALVDRAAAAEVLGLPENVAAYCLVPVGWPMGRFGPVTRLPVEETVR